LRNVYVMQEKIKLLCKIQVIRVFSELLDIKLLIISYLRIYQLSPADYSPFNSENVIYFLNNVSFKNFFFYNY